MANRIQNKRSSIEGRRPDGSYLEPGEIALNTNAKDPGLFFEGNDGSILKAGPAHVGKVAPYTEVGYGNGEAWFNSATRGFSVWSSEEDKWIRNIAVPHGGSLEVVYVGSSYPEASDDVANDGASRPFATLNRAVAEISKRSILSSRDDAPGNNKYVIFLLPGFNTVHNEPGLYSDQFKTVFPPLAEADTISPEVLGKMNPEQGGLIIPRGTSIIGQDPTKTFIRPTFYPHWDRQDFIGSPNTVDERCNILSWTGNSHISGVTFIDKNDDVSVKEIDGEMEEIATLTSLDPHGFRHLDLNDEEDPEFTWFLSGDMVTLSYPDDVFLNNEGFDSVPAGTYVVEPVSPTKFYLRRSFDGSYVLRRDLPNAPSANTSPTLWADLKINLRTHHRLSAVGYTTERDLRQHYTKIQYAYSGIEFGGVSDDAQLLSSEVVIGSDLPVVPIGVDQVENKGAFLENCQILSEYGMSGIRIDGELVGGFKSSTVYDCRFVQFQNDPDVYDVYYDSQWIPLKEATWRGTNLVEDQVTDGLALAYLISSVKSENLRFYYIHNGDAPILGSDTSSGLPDDRSDTRHAAVEGLNLAEVNCDGVDVTGPAVAFWARGGSKLTIRDSRVELGIESLRAEGFSGINTLRGAEDVHIGFEVQGIRLPTTLSPIDLKNEENHIKLYTNASVRSFETDHILLEEPFDPRVIHPYTLKAGDVIWGETGDGSSKVFSVLADPPVSTDGKRINVDPAQHNLSGLAPANLLTPLYIRRFVDPRPEISRDFALWVKNTDTKHQAPEPGSILRLSEDTGASITPLLKSGCQLDPGANGGWNHTFKVHNCLTKEFGDNPNNYKTINQTTTTNTGYYLSLNPCDSFGPWLPTESYAIGAYVTSDYKSYKTRHGQIHPTTTIPSDLTTTWGNSVFFEKTQLIEQAFNSDDDPLSGDYTETDTYLRGIGYDSGAMQSTNPVDYDNGTDDLGLTDSSNKVDLNKISPTWQPTYKALKQFLILLGYDGIDLDALLVPTTWSNRNVGVVSIGTLNNDGYAASVGNWPVEFNRPSFVWCESMLWDYPGHLNYSKGLAKYRKSQLSQQLQRDCQISEVWGGRVVATGLTPDGDSINYRVTNV